MKNNEAQNGNIINRLRDDIEDINERQFMKHLETTIRKIIKKGFDILNNRSNSTEREVQFHVVLPVLEELGYPKENFFVEKHCRVDKKDLYSDVYIEVDNGTGILVETKKQKKN